MGRVSDLSRPGIDLVIQVSARTEAKDDWLGRGVQRLENEAGSITKEEAAARLRERRAEEEDGKMAMAVARKWIPCECMHEGWYYNATKAAGQSSCKW